ncbi:MAG TPA: hypothetical protein VGG03_25355 [Thermoanaerobaculia bacterium]|jgi:hypothetical protein
MDKRTKRRILIAVLVVLAVIAGITAWYKLYRDVPQPAWIRANQRDDFLYGSVGAETTAGMPYWIWLVLPRICKEPMRGQQGGYAALGRPWDQGVEMPAGFAKKTVGYVRVAGNCALCHATSRIGPQGVPVVAVAGPGQTTDIQRLLTFFTECAQDPHFNADEILSEIDMATKLSFVDRLLYRFVLIPRTRQALLDRRLMLDSALRRHSRNPHAPFTQQRMQDLAAWLRAQHQTAARPETVRTGGRN